MRLATYLENSGISHAEFANSIGVTRDAVRFWALGDRTPRPALMAKIISVTNGAVTANDFLPAAKEPSEIEAAE